VTVCGCDGCPIGCPCDVEAVADKLLQLVSFDLQ
jgi:hypothetical protein